MSETVAVPAGWYPEPSGAGGQRWWDGARWTEHATAAPAPVYPSAPQYAPYGSARAATVAAGTPVDTLWIWLVVALPLVSILPFFAWDADGYMRRVMSPSATALDQLGPYTDPWYLTAVLLGWVVYGLTVWFAYLDTAALARLGYTRRFHWAWAFLWSLVYVIGRSVVVKKQAGRGTAPMWVAIGLNVAILVASMVWSVMLIVSAVTFGVQAASTMS